MKNYNEAELASTHPIIPQTSQSPQAQSAQFDAIAPCPSCGHTRFNLVRMPNYSLHYAARRCGQCDTFRGWEPKPEKQNKQQRNKTTITKLLKSSRLSQWEGEFLSSVPGGRIPPGNSRESVKGKRSLSPKQQGILTAIEAKVGGQR